MVREGLSRVLGAEAGFEIVGTCGDGAGALGLVARCHPDVVLLDLALPDRDGLDLIGPMVERSPKTRILILSMFSEPEYAAAALDRGAFGLVAKSASPETLIDAIRRVARGDAIPAEHVLTAREQEVLTRLAAGDGNDEIAAALGIQCKTVEGYCQRLMDKLGIHTRAGLIAHARRANFS
jgi:DNA-binding NarL/FixJ family response regulator